MAKKRNQNRNRPPTGAARPAAAATPSPDHDDIAIEAATAAFEGAIDVAPGDGADDAGVATLAVEAAESAAEIPAAPVVRHSPPAAYAELRHEQAAHPVDIGSDGRTGIRGVLIQIAGARLLLPNATIAEVLSYADPDPVGGDAPDWLLGRMRWRGWHLPLIAFSTLAGVSAERGGLGSKVVVLKALGDSAKTPYFAILTQGFPRLVTVSEDGLVLESEVGDASLPRGVQARVRLNQDEALLPDLEAVEHLVAEALAQAA